MLKTRYLGSLLSIFLKMWAKKFDGCVERQQVVDITGDLWILTWNGDCLGAAEKSKIIFIWQKKTAVLIYVRKYKRRLTVQSRQQLESIKIISV
jgi:hypothetical protein